MVGDLSRIVARNLGLLLRYMSWVPLLVLPVAAWFREWASVPGVLVASVLLYASGSLLARVPAPREPRLREGLLIAASAWLVVPLLSTPIFLLGEEWRLLDAFFETMSAWTGTGMTVADVTILARTTLAWRSVMQWVGGLGVIVLTLAILARPGTSAHALYVSEAREDKLRPSVLSTVRTLWRIYVALTVFAVLLLLLVGLPPWHAFNHGLTGIATGGMTITTRSIGAYADPVVEAAVIVIMLAGATPFVVHYAILRGRWRAFHTDPQVRALFVILLFGLPFVTWSLTRAVTLPVPEMLRLTTFQLVSAVTTTGFNTADVSQWAPSTKVAIAGVMLLGGAAGSTSGGLKLVRAVILLKGSLWKLERSGLPPFAVTTFRFGGRTFDLNEANEEFADAAFVAALWGVALFLGILVMLVFYPGVPLQDLLFELSSVLGNGGLSIGLVGPHTPDAVKAVLTGVMWAGRLEILPVILLLRALLPSVTKP